MPHHNAGSRRWRRGGNVADRMCHRKVAYRSRAEALRAVTITPGAIRTYRCPLCGFIHITSAPNK